MEHLVKIPRPKAFRTDWFDRTSRGQGCPRSGAWGYPTLSDTRRYTGRNGYMVKWLHR